MEKKSPSTDLDVMLGERASRLIEARRMPVEGFAKSVGIDGGYMRRLLKGVSRWNTSHIESIAAGLGVSVLDLFAEYTTEDWVSQHALIPLVDVQAQAGIEGYLTGDFPAVIDTYPFKRRWLASKGYKSPERVKDLHLIKVRGDSMSPRIDDGEVVLVDPNLSMRLPESVQNGRIYIIRWGTMEPGISAKYVHYDPNEGMLIAKSENELYLPKRIQLREGTQLSEYILGKVIWIGKENI